MANVLIADDNREIASVLKEYVEREGYTVFLAADGRKALEIFSANEFDMVYTESGNGGAPSVDPPVIKTKAGRYEVSYYAAS